MRHVASLSVVAGAFGCLLGNQPTIQPQVDLPDSTPVLPLHNLTVDSILETLTVREKVGQLIMPWLLGNYIATEGDAFDNAAEWIDEFAIGGITISIGSPLAAAAKLNALQERSPLPLIVAADLEYGAAMRMVGATGFPMPMGSGATDLTTCPAASHLPVSPSNRCRVAVHCHRTGLIHLSSSHVVREFGACRRTTYREES